MIGLQPFKASLDRFPKRRGAPIRITPSSFMAAFGKEIVITSSGTDRISDQFLTGNVTLRRIDDVDPDVESTIQQFVTEASDARS